MILRIALGLALIAAGVATQQPAAFTGSSVLWLGGAMLLILTLSRKVRS